MIEDHVADLSKHRYLISSGYRIIRRYENNGWYVPNESTVVLRWPDRWEILRKYYLALPFRVLRNFSRRIRKPLKLDPAIPPERRSTVSGQRS
jgi:hypothetical protein